MPRHVFFSFHYNGDSWRASKIRNIGVIGGARPVYDNDWEEVRHKSDAAIERWIDAQLSGRSCVVVLIGAQTAGRKWIEYEIERGWNLGKGVVGIHIHNIGDRYNQTSNMGVNPFSSFNLNGIQLDRIVRTYNPAGWGSQQVYRTIAENIDGWVDEAISIRGQYRR